MSDRNFRKLIEAKWAQDKFVCVGLDSEFERIPAHVGNKEAGVFSSIVEFNRKIIESTKDLVCAYKPNIAFYEAHGSEGLSALQETIRSIRSIAPDVPVILDAKRADIGNTNAGYVDAAFGILRADAITIHPYLGSEALRPFLECKDKGIFVLCRTSNPGAGEFQDLPLIGGGTLYETIAYRVSHTTAWNENGNCGLVVGATYPEELQEIRGIVGDMPILIPGIGTQGGDVEKTVKAGEDNRGRGMIINSSRGIIFASNGRDFADAARRETLKLHNLINQYRWKG
ncbi:MAG: orotidine-5'-phosphate decarboxylase [bacterium]|nr:orotidine-5'-phosphate decarboxylase [bacterium]